MNFLGFLLNFCCRTVKSVIKSHKDKGEKKMKKRVVSITLTLVLIFSLSVFSFAENGVSASEEKTISVTFRIEGYKNNLYNKSVDVKFSTETISLKDALKMIDEQEADITLKGIDDGYISDINGETEGTFGGNDGWMFAVNDEVSQVSISDVTLKNGDSIVFYYGDFPCQYTLVDSSDAKNGILRFYSKENNYDENYNVTGTYESPITDAPVTVDGEEFTTDSNGVVDLGHTLKNGEHTVSLKKVKSTDNGDIPVAVRLENYKIIIGDFVEAPNYTAYIVVTVIVILVIAAGTFLLIVNKKKKQIK